MGLGFSKVRELLRTLLAPEPVLPPWLSELLVRRLVTPANELEPELVILLEVELAALIVELLVAAAVIALELKPLVLLLVLLLPTVALDDAS